MAAIEIKVPDIGDFKDIPVIELLVKPGDVVAKEESLVTLESDKATMEVPSSHAGTVKEMRIKVGDKVSQGTVIAVLDTAATAASAPSPAAAEAAPPAPAASAPTPAAAPAAQASGQTVRQALNSTLASLDSDLHAEVLVLGAGPGGYTAAFRAADLGKKVVLVERYASLGGVCLNVGCIPSKALLHAAKIITDAEEGSHIGLAFGEPKIELDGVRKFKDGVVGKLTKGLSGLAKGRKVTVLEGKAQFSSPQTLEVETKEGKKVVSFDNCIIAAGSQSARIPGFPYDDPRLMDSTGALELKDVPKRLLIIGGGIIGLEMATVYDALGSKVSVVEFMDRLIPGADPDIIKPLAKRIEKRYEKIMLKTKVARVEALPGGLKAHFEDASGGAGPAPEVYDRILLAVGRRPNGRNIGADKAGVTVDERGWIPVDNQMRTNVPHIFAIGDIVGEPMLAHKATHEGKLAAEVIAGMSHHAWEARTIPSVAYTDPEVAWMGLSEPEAKAQGVEYEKAVFPWAASGRALGMGREEGLTKVLYEKGSKRILGAGIVGVNAGELIAEAVLALEMGADAEDIGLTIHPHPTLSETLFFTAEIAEGSITDMLPPKKAGVTADKQRRETAERLANWGTESKSAFAEARDPARLASAVVTLHRRVDEVLATTIEGHKVPIACARGCSYCCNLRVQVQPYEAFTLAAWLKRAFDAKRLAGVVERLRANVARTRELGEERRKRANIACALLGPDGACTAYEARPAQCRRYHSTDVAPCKSFFESHDDAIEAAMHQAVAHNADVIITQGRHAVRAAGLDDASVDMNEALLEALENPKAWRRWRDGKKPFVSKG